jgi:hypothetical protein
MCVREGRLALRGGLHALSSQALTVTPSASAISPHVPTVATLCIA